MSERPIEATLSELTTVVTPRASATVVQSSGDHRVLIAAVLIASVAVAGALAFVFLRPSSSAEKTFIVVQGDKQGPNKPPVVADARAPEPAGDTVDMDFTIDDVEAELANIKGSRPPARPQDKDPARLLARSFDKQKQGVVRCLRDHGNDLPAEAALSVRIELDQGGAVKNASVSPDVLAQTPVGQCVVTAAESMQFGAQSSPLAFRVPLTAKRQ